jgi:type II restriction enzyme
MSELRITDVISAIQKLGFNQSYDYYNKKTKIRITEIMKPEGPIKFVRWNSLINEKEATSGGVSINQLGTIASVFSNKPNYPIHIDRLFSAGGNSRSALETLLAYTPNFFICYPQRTNPYTGQIENKQKHLMWCPNESHPLGQLCTKDYQQVISEIELDVNFGNIVVTPSMLNDEFDTIASKKTHTQMQVALVRIGNALNFHTWIARNDRSIQVENMELGKMEGVVPSLDDVKILYTNENKKAASLIDCIWFSHDFQHIPAVLEVEHSTGVTSGLTRMLKFKETVPAIMMTFAVVADNTLRNKVVAEACNYAFRSMKTRFMPYSAVRELYGLIRNYNLGKVVDRSFIEPFMENVVDKL